MLREMLKEKSYQQQRMFCELCRSLYFAIRIIKLWVLKNANYSSKIILVVALIDKLNKSEDLRGIVGVPLGAGYEAN